MWSVHADSSQEVTDEFGVKEGQGPEWQKNFDSLETKYATDKRKASVIDMLINAAKVDDIDIVKSLVAESRINPNSRNAKGWTALLRASKSNSLHTVKFLCKVSADVDTRTKEGNAPLHKAAKHGHIAVAEELCKAGANPNVKNNGDATPLMVAAMHKNSEGVLRVLIEAGAVVNEKKDVGYTPLMLAARFGNCGSISHLLLASVLTWRLKTSKAKLPWRRPGSTRRSRHRSYSSRTEQNNASHRRRTRGVGRRQRVAKAFPDPGLRLQAARRVAIQAADEQQVA
eukprot:gb/GFBE01036016.1/.p1 GENE.gb/GFBE01036016.1/~~gb/GFBE01036016.1/.p1  ORF type:complete len:285 (+),score=61.97 gb/GFBE01036016.1/:1-855(+)